jgi:predicted dehydrogenase
MDKVRLGFVGVGGMGQCAHLRNYATLSNCEVVALAELRPGLGRKVAARYGVPSVYRDHREMLAREKLDGIVAIQPFQVHGQLVPELLEYGVPVLIEKPIARSVEAGEKILEAQRKSKGKLFVGYHKRVDQAVRFAIGRIHHWKQFPENDLGPMKLVRCTMPPGDWQAAGFSVLITTDEPYPDLPKDPPPAGMDEPTAKAYEAFVNYYIHQVNLMRHLMGQSYQVTYADRGGVVMVTRGDEGVTGVLEMAPYRTTKDWQESALVAFEKGYIRIDLPAPLAIDQAGRVTIFEDRGGCHRGQITQPTLAPLHAMRHQAEMFLAYIQKGHNFALCEAAEAVEDLRIARRYIEMKATS